MTIFSGSNKTKTRLHPPRQSLLPLRVIGPVNPDQPTRLILPTSDFISKFQRDGLREEFDFEPGDRFITDLFEQLTYEHEAQLMLSVFAEEIAHDITCGLEAERLMRHIVHLGTQIHQLLQLLKVYQRGYLFHQFVQWWGADVIIGDFRLLDMEPEDH